MKARTSFALSFLLLGGLALCGCAAHTLPAPPPPPVRVCAAIPIPARPVLPSVILPEPDGEGQYCLTQGQVDSLADGIRALKLYASQLEAAATVHNEHLQGE